MHSASHANLLTMAVILLLCIISSAPSRAAAASAHALVTDAPDDTPYSFSEQADLTAVAVTWTDHLVVQATYKAPPPTPVLHLLVSSAARDELDPSVYECDGNMADSFTVDADRRGATFRDPYIEGELTAPPAWDGTTVTYTFSSPTLVRKFNDNHVDPFACVDGIAQDDTFYGAFDAKMLKLTATAAEEGVRRELDRRYRVGRQPDTHVRCLSRGTREATDHASAQRWCAYRAHVGRSVAFGEVSVFLAEGEAQTSAFSAKRFPTGTRECGTTDFSGRWLLTPFPQNFGGASMTVWAKRTSCRTAKRVARAVGRTAGFRCRTTKNGYEHLALRCTARGGRTVWYETGS